MWNISAWLDEIEPQTPLGAQGTKKRKRDRETTPTEKRPRLAPMDANISTGTRASAAARRSSPRKQTGLISIFEDDDVRLPSTPRVRPAGLGEGNTRWNASSSAAAASAGEEAHAVAMLGGEDGEQTPRKNAPRRAEQEQTPRNNARRPTERFQPHFRPPHMSESASQSSRSSAGRSKSPVKDMVDLQMADAPIRQYARRDTPLPRCVYPLLERLEDFADGNGVVPAIAKEATKREVTRFFDRWVAETPDPSDERDLVDLLDIVEYAQSLEGYNQAEAAWNSEAHSPILRVALRSFPGRVTHYNVTQARPIPEFLPTRGPRITEARLVDYAVSITPTPDEDRDINHLLRREPDCRATISQSRATALRTHPIAISIETKADSGTTGEAKNQLGVWAYAHFERMRTLLGLEEDVPPGEESIMAVHPIIYVQQHDWIMALVVARKAGTEFAEIDLKLRIGGTGSLLELWKLRASLRCLGQWAEEKYWPTLYKRIRATLENLGDV
ncbi:uncharacterized protein MYCFIDRAFT_89145 [Pseudocercospora fijiensis CIRAD86]|uniref:PD-(D/E)XK nuclease-like domain-containing protein n=1 Tax=Pseudocercospora fijiensis (strain CIRAD86) TaxID=383855 RepID=M2ZY35_PSEFD|nr:uncharacterized protein MYCFIDRAFT_89145 [Pseudocercospora fijiensis CIRAD86]EME77031.1 hypothetical protein MYCFIDRAFT_89145 [Pseudocercospora fijiensis CIRAD86]